MALVACVAGCAVTGSYDFDGYAPTPADGGSGGASAGASGATSAGTGGTGQSGGAGNGGTQAGSGGKSGAPAIGGGAGNGGSGGAAQGGAGQSGSGGEGQSGTAGAGGAGQSGSGGAGQSGSGGAGQSGASGAGQSGSGGAGQSGSGGTGQSGQGGAGQGGSGGAGQSGSGGASGAGIGGAGVSGSAGSAGCAQPTTWYHDGDSDGHGTSLLSFVVSCDKPADVAGQGTWATNNDDCNDGDQDVFPGQIKYFGVPYAKAGASGNVSFDYDCDGQETPTAPIYAPNCSGLALGSCSGTGYVTYTPARSGTGVDSYCGSTHTISCVTQTVFCVAGGQVAAAALACR